MEKPHPENDLQLLPPMSSQQTRFSVSGGFAQYRELISEDRSWAYFLGYELYTLLFSNLSSLLGLAARRLLLPLFLGKVGARTVVGRSVTIRQPHRIALGRGVIIDDFVTLDVRAHQQRGAEIGIEIGDHALLGRNSIIVAKDGTIRLGSACNIGSDCRIATQSSITIGNSVLIAAYVYIGPGNHRMVSTEVPLIQQGMDIRGGVRIGDHAWIGTRATILDGVSIGEEAIVGAHSLVTEDVPARAIVVGTPAKIIRYRE